MPHHVFFDLDNTLTRSRTEIATEYRPIFERLSKKKDVIVVSGAREEQIRTQLTKEFDGSYYILAQRGNHAIHKNGQILWRESLDETQSEAIYAFIEKIKKELGIIVKDENDLVENRGSQIGYSLIGHHEDLGKKEVFDPGSVKRLHMLDVHKEDVEHLLHLGVAVEPGGTTSIDFFLAGKDKGFNIERLLATLSWHKEDCLYLGDELEEGRNDESVIGIIPTHAVKNPGDTFGFIESELLS